MAYTQGVSPETFEAIHNVNTDKLSTLTEQQLRPILPCLVRMSLCAPLDTSEKWTLERKKILKCLSGIDVVNSLVALLSIDFHELEQDAKKEMNIGNKLGGTQTESTLISQLEQGLTLDFERSDAARKLRLLLSELLFIMSQMKETRVGFYHKSSELFESDVYLEEVSDVLCIAQAELPSLLPVTEVAEALLHVENGPWLLCRVVANVPDSFYHVCTSLISNGEQQDEETVGGQRRSEALRMLCEMCPSQALTIRALCVKHCRLPSLAVALTLHHCHETSDVGKAGDVTEGLSDVVGFVIGLLLGSDQKVRYWFAQFIRNGQKRKDSSSILHALRQELLEQLICILPIVHDAQVVQGCAFIRLYCALKCITGLRFNDEEIRVLLRLITCHPQPSGAGVRFISLSLCLLLACPYLLGNMEQEKIAVSWLKWLVQESGHFEKASGVKASFGEMLLLIAIHFHSSQNVAIVDLVSSTLGIQAAVKANALSKMKTLFIQEIFTEQIVAAHAVKVHVTQGLNAHISGYLPIHCIYHLLKTRAFSKHKVNIKDWIFKQLCSSTTPIHPLVPPLIEVYVNSIIMPSSKTDRMNEPISEEEILSVFKHSVLTQHLGGNSSSGGVVYMETDCEPEEPRSNLTAQLLLLYYILLYQDTLLTNMKNIATSNRKILQYGDQLLSQLPIKALVREAQKEQLLYAGLFSPLLKLLATHFPHLCLVEDWLDENLHDSVFKTSTICVPDLLCSVPAVHKAFSLLPNEPTELLLYLDQLSALSAQDLLPYTEVIVDNLNRLLDPNIPRKVLELVKTVWIKLHTVIPRKLRVMTVNSLRPSRSISFNNKPFTENDITLDPIIVLQSDERIFRCPPLTEIVLRVLEAFLQASRCYMTEQVQANPVIDKSGQIQPTIEREELKNALLAAQESAAVQILLESCLPKDESEKSGDLLSDLREVQCLVCSRLHQMFIADPNLVKLVHFQGYPSELLPMAVAGIPSMHICLDFIPELLSQPHLDKQLDCVISLRSRLVIKRS
ncbi:hypothetical protein LSH36_469g02035 [Paralvinella palmiformis]|uniref:Integrator complex subunit 2 n=1 Tax=Paralvinella palmiformis TaxID=53620 RepID=A0AAD9J9N6_9ANNE|nr:hypothetical protein LSH36_469g02035 [Paralvinella palmiformis]